jgi:hypothetical protein
VGGPTAAGDEAGHLGYDPGAMTEQVQRRRLGIRRQSAFRVGALPLVSIAFGPDLASGERRGSARGVIALGDEASGVLALGGRARGFVAVGGRARGVFAMGGLAVGVVAVGGLAVGLAAMGGAALGLVSLGGAAAGYLSAGGAAWGRHTYPGKRPRTRATAGR